MTDLDPKALALAAHLNVAPSTIEDRGDVFEAEDEPGEYRVLTDSERESELDAAHESYIDECIIDQAKAEARRHEGLESLVETLADYFDRGKWKRDAMHDGAGSFLASYDSDEHEQQIDGAWYFIYRIG